jgi:hypothetical protein
MSLGEITLNVILSLVTGVISGDIVTRYYRKKDEVRIFKEKLQEFSHYLTSISERLDMNDCETTSFIIRDILKYDEAPIVHDLEIKFTQKEKEHLAEARSIIDEIKEKVRDSEYVLSPSEIIDFKKRLARAAFNVLSDKQSR